MRHKDAVKKRAIERRPKPVRNPALAEALEKAKQKKVAGR